MTNQPIRLTKQRFDALRSVYLRGHDEIDAQLRDDYGIDYEDHLTSLGTHVEFRLLDEEDREAAAAIIAEMRAAEDAWVILNRRYGTKRQ
jgi:hypothetical protein